MPPKSPGIMSHLVSRFETSRGSKSLGLEVVEMVEVEVGAAPVRPRVARSWMVREERWVGFMVGFAEDCEEIGRVRFGEGVEDEGWKVVRDTKGVLSHLYMVVSYLQYLCWLLEDLCRPLFQSKLEDAITWVRSAIPSTINASKNDYANILRRK